MSQHWQQCKQAISYGQCFLLVGFRDVNRFVLLLLVDINNDFDFYVLLIVSNNVYDRFFIVIDYEWIVVKKYSI